MIHEFNTRAEALADWVCLLELSDCGAADIEKAKDLLLDHLGVMLGGAGEDSARTAFDYARSQGSDGGGGAGASLFGGDGTRLPAELIAFAHATAGHSIEMDDIHNASSIHPGVATIPAALAVADEFDATGADLLAAIIAGYEVILRVGEAANPSAVYKRGFHPTAVCGVFSSAAAAGRLMGLDAEQMTHALGLAWSFSAGNMSFQTEGSWAKRLQVGNTARAGVQAARLARLGATGPKHVFEPHGFFQGYSGSADPDVLTRNLGQGLKVTEVGVKPFACCRYNQPPVDGLLELRAKHDLKPDAIERIDIAIPSTGMPLVAEPAESKRAPADNVEAQFSLYHSAAVALVTGSAGVDQFREPWLDNAEVRDLAQRVHAGSDPAIDAVFPQKWAARIKITARDGRELDYFSEESLGDPGKPLTREGLIEKFNSLTKNVLDESKSAEAIEILLALDQKPKARNLINAVTSAIV